MPLARGIHGSLHLSYRDELFQARHRYLVRVSQLREPLLLHARQSRMVGKDVAAQRPAACIPYRSSPATLDGYCPPELVVWVSISWRCA